MEELLRIAYSPGLSESGGSHNQKGVDFQRYWIIYRMLELETQGVEDFLILVEALQDVAEINSENNPTSLKLYQVKKKDRKEWTWNELTNTTISSKKPKNKNDFFSSPIGKLYTSLLAITELEVAGYFVSNRGCDIPLVDGINVATTFSPSISDIKEEFRTALIDTMKTVCSEAKAEQLSKKIYFEKVPINIDGMKEHMIGHIFSFLSMRSPRHANQASSFLDALISQLAPLGRNTDRCQDVNELKARHGFSKKQLSKAFSTLETIPDPIEILDLWLKQLENDRFDFWEVTAIRLSATRFYQRQVSDALLESDEKLIDHCDSYLSKKPDMKKISEFLANAFAHISPKFKDLKKSDIEAQILLRTIKLCVNQA